MFGFLARLRIDVRTPASWVLVSLKIGALEPAQRFIAELLEACRAAAEAITKTDKRR